MFISATITSLVTAIDVNPLTIAIFCTVFGCITMVMSQVVSLSQIHTVAKTKNTSGTSLLTYIFFVIMSLLSMSWAMTFYFNSGLPEGADIVLQQLRIVPLIICYFADLIYSLVMTAIKVRYMVLAKKMNKTELELSVYLLNQQQKKYVASHYKKRYSKYFKFVCLIIGASTLIILFGTFFSLYTADTITKIGTSHPVDSDVVMTLSLLGAFAWEAISWPQFIKCIKYRDTSGISLNWAIFLPMACVISFIYALLLGFGVDSFALDTLGALIFNGMIVNFGILVIKAQNILKARKLGISELEYTKIKLLPKIKAKQEKIHAKKKKRA